MAKLQRVGLSRSLLDDVFGIFGIANCISAKCASKQIYGELVRDSMRAIPDPFKKLSIFFLHARVGGARYARWAASAPRFF